MKYFAKRFLVPYVAASGYRRLCEVGTKLGGNTDRMLALKSIEITIIDPCLSADLLGKFANETRIDVKKGLSLEVLPTIEEPFDCIMLDGDHNWYTVYHELEVIHQKGLLAPGGTIFLHDICWPYARRDMYYQPDTVPAEYRKPSAKKGMLRGISELCDDPSISKNSEVYNATQEGGPRNGVLTAVEDFLGNYLDIYEFLAVRKEWGLGVIMRRKECNAAFRRLRLKAIFHNSFEAVMQKIRRATGRLPYQPRSSALRC